jgi:hypothetical protein
MVVSILQGLSGGVAHNAKEKGGVSAAPPVLRDWLSI